MGAGVLHGWYNSLVGAKYDNTKSPNQKKRGRKPISQEIIDEVLTLAQNNLDWATTALPERCGVLATMSLPARSDYGIVPDSERRLHRDWDQFIETQQYSTASTDFAQVERLTPFGLVRESLLFFMDIGSREVRFGGMVHAPDSNWTTQIARDMWDGFLLGKKYLIHDRNNLFNRRFDSVFESIGIEIKNCRRSRRR